jgi:hypothetical protein
MNTDPNWFREMERAQAEEARRARQSYETEQPDPATMSMRELQQEVDRFMNELMSNVAMTSARLWSSYSKIPIAPPTPKRKISFDDF